MPRSPDHKVSGTLDYLLSSTVEEIVMFQILSLRLATVAALGVLLVLWGDAQAGQALKADAASSLEVRVLEAQVSPGQGEYDEVLYRMEVISVLRSTSRVTPGDTIVVRAYTLSKEAMDRGSVGSTVPALLAPGWLGVAYLNPVPKSRGQFAIAANGDSFEDI
ncbi:hypothetical protein, partial [Thiocystis minor]|uniref:hypothetical protein n=1 Tax=Thiocystis minor TaxID=61597 RepID=UPI0019141D5E